MVLGAQRRDVLRMVLRTGAGTLLLGMTFGAVGAIAGPLLVAPSGLAAATAGWNELAGPYAAAARVSGPDARTKGTFGTAGHVADYRHSDQPRHLRAHGGGDAYVRRGSAFSGSIVHASRPNIDDHVPDHRSRCRRARLLQAGVPSVARIIRVLG